MPYPRRLLGEEERVILDLRPHPVRLFGSVARSAVVFGAIGYGFFAWRTAPTWFGLALGITAVLTVVYLTSKVVAWRMTLFVLTTRRVIVRTGVLRRVGREIPIERVDEVTYHQRFTERLLRSGTLTVASGGDRGPQIFTNVRRPAFVQSEINRAAFRPAAPEEPLRSARRGVEVDLETLEELAERGVMTDAELAQKRQELLDGR